MEALLEKEGDVENWNDDRLDELSQMVKEGFARIDRRFDQLPTREEIDQRFSAAARDVDHRVGATDREVNNRFDSTERRIDRVSGRLEHMVWAMVAAAGGLFGHLFADKI